MSRDELSEQQAADLLRRAAHLQARADNDHGPGLTLDEVKRAAHAAGIDPVFVEQAALGAGDDLPPSEPFLGMQTGSRRTRVVPGRVSDAEWGKMVAALRRQLGGTGTQESIGEVREWRREPYHFLLEPEGDDTRITASAYWRGDSIGATGFVAMMVGISVMMTVLALGNPADLPWIISVLFSLGTIAAAAVVRPRLWAKGPRIDGKLDRALDALAGLAGEEERAEALASAPEVPDATGSRIDPALLDVDPEAAAPAHRRRQRDGA